jgi:hypothetical protein
LISNRISLKPKGTPKYTGCIQEKHQTRKRNKKKKKKKIKKIIETRNMETITGSLPMEKGVKKEGLKLYHHPLSVFKVLVISFSPSTPHQA